MKISFSPSDTELNVDNRRTTEKRAQSINHTTQNYAVDISGKVMDNSAYKGQGKTTEEVMQDAGQLNVAVQQDYMTVMSNCMSEKDYAKLQEDGFEPGSTEIGTAVTIVDHIKAALIEAGVSVAGFTDTLDMDTLNEITGNEALSRQMQDTFSESGVPLTENTAQNAVKALKEAETLEAPKDSTIQYMVENQMEPELENVYRAQYSSFDEGNRQGRGYYQDDAGYQAKKAEDYNWDQLMPQIEKIVEEAGIADKQAGTDGAKWLIKNGVPLNTDSLQSYMNLSELSFPMNEKELLSAMADAVSDGKSPSQADLSTKGSLWDQAVQIKETVDGITDQAADLVADENKTLTIFHLCEAQEKIDVEAVTASGENIHARRQLEEVRLQMTIEANRELIKSGYAIETTELEELVEALKNVENKQNQILFGGQSTEETSKKATLYTQTLTTVAEIPELPAAVLGRISFLEKDFTLEKTADEGQKLAAEYKKAETSYEALQTAPRSDMGDSIKKAFRNTDELLESIKLSVNEANEKAVRILGYNNMEITEENILTVKTADQALRNVIQKLTPAATLAMIRDGKNPLTQSVAELDDYLSKQQQEPEEDTEKYSKFLFKLEQKKEITEEEKESCIGVYRLLRQVEKSDGAVIGSLINQGAELSFKNLLSAVRTSKAKRMDVTVDDETGVLTDAVKKEDSISTQIESAFRGQTDSQSKQETEYYKKLFHEYYENAEQGIETSEEEQQQIQADYLKNEINQIRQTACAEEQVISMLDTLDYPVTVNHIQAAERFLKNQSEPCRKIEEAVKKKAAEKPDEKNADILMEDWQDAAKQLLDTFTDRTEAQKGYENLVQTQSEILNETVYNQDTATALDVKELGLIYKQLSFTSKMAEREQYQIPIFTEDSVLALNLKIIHSDTEKGKIEASMESSIYGTVSVNLLMKEGSVSGLLACSKEAGTDKLNELKQEMEADLKNQDYEVKDIRTAFSSSLQEKQEIPSEKAEKEDGATTKELYQIAKILVTCIQKGVQNEN